jgi:hypothetical protein
MWMGDFLDAHAVIVDPSDCQRLAAPEQNHAIMSVASKSWERYPHFFAARDGVSDLFPPNSKHTHHSTFMRLIPSTPSKKPKDKKSQWRGHQNF